MTDQLILTEELLKEFLDPQLSKFYEYKIETDFPAACKFQASFLDESGKHYFLSFYRDPSLGKNSRKVILANKKNKNLSFKINVDKGTFLRILGTIIRIYEEYKESSDGKMCTSFAFNFPENFVKFAPFIVRLISRMWKTEPKKRLAIYGAAESYQSAMVLLYANVNSTVPYFGGPAVTGNAYLETFGGPFYQELAGVHKSTADKVVKKVENPQQPTTTQSMIAKKQASVAQSKLDAPAAPVQQATPGINAHPEHEDASQDGWVEPYKDDDYDYGGIEATHIRMKVNSGSSSLKVGDEAEIYGVYMNASFETCYVQFGITANAAKSTMQGCSGVLIVKPNSNPSKYVALKLTSMTGNTNAMFWYLDADNKSPEDIEKDKKKKEQELLTKQISTKVPTNPQAKKVQELPDNYITQLYDGMRDFQLGPIKIDIVGSTIFDLTDKIREIQQMFGKMDPSKIAQNCDSFMSQSMSQNAVLNKIFNNFAKKNGLFLKDGSDSKAVTDYTGSDYGSINQFLRFGKVPNYTNEDYVKSKISQIDACFSKNGVRLPKTLKVYRGASISAKDIESLNKMESAPLTGYASVSLSIATALQFGGLSGTDITSLIRGQLMAFDDEKPDDLGEVYFDSKQGNKILYSISRLDRCLSLMLKEVSNYSHEEEILLNRGTEIKVSQGQKVYKVANRYTGAVHVTDNDGIWFARAEVVSDGLIESSLRDYLLREAIQKTGEVMDNLAILYVCLDDIKQSVESR